MNNQIRVGGLRNAHAFGRARRVSVSAAAAVAIGVLGLGAEAPAYAGIPNNTPCDVQLSFTHTAGAGYTANGGVYLGDCPARTVTFQLKQNGVATNLGTASGGYVGVNSVFHPVRGSRYQIVAVLYRPNGAELGWASSGDPQVLAQ